MLTKVLNVGNHLCVSLRHTRRLMQLFYGVFIAVNVAFNTLPIIYAQDHTQALLLSEEGSAHSERQIIEEIRIHGTVTLTHETILKALALDEKSTISLAQANLSQAFHRLCRHDVVKDVAITTSGVGHNRVILDVYLKEYDTLSGYVLTGITSKETAAILKKINLEEGIAATPMLYKQIQHTIQQHYLAMGYADVEISITSVPSTQFPHQTQWYIHIDKGVKWKIDGIRFEGNRHVHGSTLRSRMQHIKRSPRFTLLKHAIGLKRRVPLPKFSSTSSIVDYLQDHIVLFNSVFTQEKLEEDKEHLLAYYRGIGFLDATIVDTTVERLANNRVNICIKIDEGQSYRIGSIHWIGNYFYNTTTLQQRVKIQSGDAYNTFVLQQKLYQDPERNDIASLYMDEGYLFFHVDLLKVGIRDNEVHLEAHIQEGARLKVGHVAIEGNTITYDYVIRRALKTYPGDVLSRTNLQKSLRALSYLGLFNPKTLDVALKTDSLNSVADLIYKVKEVPDFGLFFEVSHHKQLIGSLGLSSNNLALGNLMHMDTLWGGGQKMELQCNFPIKGGAKATFQFIEPWLLGALPWHFQFDTHYTIPAKSNTDRAFDYKNASWGLSLGLGHTLAHFDEYLTCQFDVVLAQYYYSDFDFDIDMYKGKHSGILKEIAGKIHLVYNSTGPTPFFPTEGMSTALQIYMTPPRQAIFPIENYKTYQQLLLNHSYFTSLPAQWVLNLQLNFGVCSSILGKQTHQHPFGQFSFMSSNHISSNRENILSQKHILLRGYDGTEKLSTGCNKGKFYHKFVLEFRRPIIAHTAYGILFFEGGNLFSKGRDINLFSMKKSLGVGIRLTIPGFNHVAALDLSYSLDRGPSEHFYDDLKLSFSLQRDTQTL